MRAGVQGITAQFASDFRAEIALRIVGWEPVRDQIRLALPGRCVRLGDTRTHSPVED